MLWFAQLGLVLLCRRKRVVRITNVYARGHHQQDLVLNLIVIKLTEKSITSAGGPIFRPITDLLHYISGIWYM